MSILNKAIQAAAQLARKSPAPDVGATIRAALASAGLKTDGKAGLSMPEAFGCMAPTAAPKILGALMPDWSRARGLKREPEPAAKADGPFAWHSIVGPWGTRRYKLFVPEGVGTPTALIVMLHGCSQNPDDFAAGTRMNVVAAEHGAVVAYPEQIRSANMSSCWNWFDAAHQKHGTGEPGLIAAIAREVMAAHAVPPGRTFVAGLSAGGAMAAILAHTDRDLFAAVGIHSGLPYLAATDIPSAFAAMQGNGPVAALSARASFSGVPAIIFHGDADRTVNVSNADALVARLTEQGRKPEIQRGAATDGTPYVRSVGRGGDGTVRFEDWRVSGAGHAWSGGSRAGSYAEPSGPDASREMMRFFLEQVRHPRPVAALAG